MNEQNIQDIIAQFVSVVQDAATQNNTSAKKCIAMLELEIVTIQKFTIQNVPFGIRSSENTSNVSPLGIS